MAYAMETWRADRNLLPDEGKRQCLKFALHPGRILDAAASVARAPCLVEVRAAAHVASSEPCATGTLKRLLSIPISWQPRGVYILRHRARQILCGSPRATARCSVRDLFGQSIPLSTGQTLQFRCLACRFHYPDQMFLRSKPPVATSCESASARG